MQLSPVCLRILHEARTTGIIMNMFDQPFSLPGDFKCPPQWNQISNPTGITLTLLGLFVLLVVFFLDTSDVPYIRGLPSAPGVPIFGNLIELGVEHPKRLAELAKKHGPVFQIRLGNRVRRPSLVKYDTPC